MRGLIAGMGLAIAAMTAMPVPAHAGPDPEALRAPTGRYRLFAGNLGAITINQVYYGLNTRGEVGVDSTNSSTIGGGYWPKGTGNQYMFNSGLQVAGIIEGDRATNPWAGDTTGGMFFDASGLRQHGTAVTELWNAANPSDVANWPQAAYVPQGDASEELFAPLLRGRVSASQGDVWWMSSEADPGLNAARPHPLGIVAEYRVMGWNYPTGNEDLIYLILTFYNITSSNAADYAHYRPGIRDILLDEAAKFKALNNANFSITLPNDGYTIDPFYAAFAADPDIVAGGAGSNFSSVNLPFALGFAYHADMPRANGWTFSPSIFGPPFFSGAGFVGVKYLKSATGAGEIALFSNTTNGGAFPDPNSAVRLYKYMSGTITPADGVSCNQGDPLVSRMCYVSDVNPADVRLMQSSTPFRLEAGQSASIVVSYIHAAPYNIPGFPGAGTRVPPGDPKRLTDATALSIGANRVDSLQGFLGFSDANSDGLVQQAEIKAAPGSLLGKAKLAQEIFDNKFLLPFSPDAPDFFLVPGNGQVTVVWKPSKAETDGDPFFQVAKDASVVPAGGGSPVVNTLYDPNYRQFDVEGYRIYRGRADNSTALKLIAQYDYSGTTFFDYTGQVVDDARGSKCAPEIGVTGSCAGVFDPQVPGVQLVKKVGYNIGANFVQVARGGRTQLASGDIINLSTDTAVTGLGSGFPALEDGGVPFVYVDHETRNGLVYFYAVTAFDVNSLTSTGRGNTSLESALITKRVVPGTTAGNYSNVATTQIGVFGRNGLLTDKTMPTLDPTTGMFSKAMPPTDAVSVSLAAFVKELLTEPGRVSFTIDSVRAVSFSGASSATSTFYYSVIAPAGTTQFAETITMSATTGVTSTSGSFPALAADPDLAARYNAPAGAYGIGGSFTVRYPAGYYIGPRSRGCVNHASGFPSATACSNNDVRWFEGPNETVADPNASNPDRWNTDLSRLDFNNAGGGLTGVTTIYKPRAYDDYTSSWRDVEQVLAAGAGAADYKVYWGAAGKVDSVIDVTHDVVVPFNAKYMGATWGILNQAATQNGATYYDQRPELTVTDIGCVEPIKSLNPGGVRCTGTAAQLSETAIPGPIAYGSSGSTAVERTSAVAAGQGFVFYLKGRPFMFELAAGVPAEGSVWTMRDYVGAISGGNGRSGNGGKYLFTTQSQVRHFSAVGASVSFAFDLTNAVGSSTKESLAKIHTVPDPYYVTSPYEATTTSKIIKFVNLPEVATIRIYTSSGVLVRVLKQASTNFGGEITWDVRNRNNQFVASGVYFYHVTAENGESTVGRMTIINYAL